MSPLTRRILAINLLAPGILVIGLLYLDEYRAGLIEQQVQALFVQGELMAGALGESAVTSAEGAPALDREVARQIVRRLAVATDTRTRLFSDTGEMLADSRILIAAGRDVVYRPLPPPKPQPVAPLQWLYDLVAPIIKRDEQLPLYRERFAQTAADYDEVIESLDGEPASVLRDAGGDGTMIISTAVPVQGLRKVVGALLLSVDSTDIDERVRSERLRVLELFTIAFVVTTLLSFYLAGTIARPVRQLARAAEQVTHAYGRRLRIPDFTARHDEIGDLSGALRIMTETLYRRLDAIEAFAADVAHEIKNPLTSLRSAVESIARTNDPEKQRRLMEIIQEDVRRLDRLISDISDASRLDAELSRGEAEMVDLPELLRALVELHREMVPGGGVRIELELPKNDKLMVPGIEGRVGQVVRNLLVNAISFSPPGGLISIKADRNRNQVRLVIDDQGPGIPDDSLEAIFQRFYSERPKGEAFGTHSGLGLSISRQIVETLGGTIRAENRRDAEGNVAGARFTVLLPG